MSHIHKPYILFALLVLLPAPANAQTEHRSRTTSLRAASNDAARLDARLDIAGPNGTLRAGDAARRARSNAVQAKDRKRDSVGNGVAIGALAGALGGAGLTGVMYARCDGTCDAPAVPAVLLPSMAVGAGIGTLIGYVVDRAR